MDIFLYPFFRNALIGIVLISIVSSLIGTYISTRRMVFLSGGITHACFGGLGLGYFLGLSPVACAAAFAVVGSLAVDLMNRRMSVRKDSAIAVIWALGMALGTLFVFLTPGYVPELNAFLFGNVLNITIPDLWLFSIFAALVAGTFMLLYRRIVAISFDSSFARTRGLPVTLLDSLMSVFTALAIVLTIKMIGIMLLMSLMTLPQMTAELFTCRYSRMLWLSMALCMLSGIAGLLLSYILSVPASATIVLTMIAIYICSRLVRQKRRKPQD